MDIKNHLALAKKLTVLLDTRFNFLGIRFGLDPLLSIIPGLGSIFGGLVSCYVLWIAIHLRVPILVYLKMVWNVFIDFLFGEIPFVGVFLDIFYKSNVKNLKLLERYTDSKVES
jgi:hypothetical protein